MRNKIIGAIALLILSGCGPGRPHLMTLELNREGNAALVGNSYQGAMEKYIEALRYDPFINSLHLNLGLSFEGLQQAEKALQSYKEAEELALKVKDFKLVFMARFNQAQLLGRAKKVDEALAIYQKALEIIPSSIEVKTNIELLTAQQQSQQGGKGDQQNQDQNQQGDQNEQQNQGDKNKDQKDQNKDQQGQGDEQKDQQDQKDQKDKKDSENKEKKYGQSPKYQPRPFKGEELSEGDVKKILGELKQQEDKIRAEYNRKEMKEQPRDKDW